MAVCAARHRDRIYVTIFVNTAGCPPHALCELPNSEQSAGANKLAADRC